MSSTIVGFFDEKDQAEKARVELLGSGIEESNIQLFSGGLDEKPMRSKKVKSEETFGERIKNFFTQMGDWKDDEAVDVYAEGIRRGGVTMSVTADESEIDDVSDVLDRYGAVDINRRAAFYKESGFTKYDMSAPPLTPDQSLAYRQQYSEWEKNRGSKLQAGQNQREEVIPVIEEKVNIGKRAIEKGRVRIYTRVTETPVEQELKLHDERVEVERIPANRPVQASDMEAFKEGEVEFRETSEEAVVGKEARVIEEVRVRKQSEERTEKVHETARRTDVEVDRSNSEGFNTSDRSADKSGLESDRLKDDEQLNR